MFSRSRYLDLAPESGSEPGADGKASGLAARIQLQPKNNQPLPTGWAIVRVHGKVLEGEPMLAVLADAGSEHPGPLRWPIAPLNGNRSGTLVCLPPGVTSLRLEVATALGRFDVEAVTLEPLNRFGVLRRLLGAQFGRIRRRPGLLLQLLRTAGRLFRQGGVRQVLAGLVGSAESRGRDYASWLALYDTLSNSDEDAIRTRVGALGYRPLISIILPVFNTQERLLVSCIESVRKQLYPNWELCIADDASTAEHVGRICASYAERDPRIRFVARRENGHISAASNSALGLATGDFVALLDHDDELAPHALYMVAQTLNESPELDLLYSDEDKIDESGKRFDPWFKTDWNHDLMLAQNSVVHLAVFRRSILEEIGGFRLGLEGSQDYDLTLRFIERTRPERIRHIPHILYHWRVTPGSVALSPDEKTYAYDAAQRAIQDHLKRTARKAEVSREAHMGYYRVRWKLPEPVPKVSLILPTKDKPKLLRTAVGSIPERTRYADYEILVVNNRSEEQATYAYFDELAAEPRVRVLDYDRPYNYAALNNWAVSQTDGPLIAFLNNDTEVITADWLWEMASQAVRPDVGAVGAKLYYPNDTIQHAGIVVGFGGLAGNPHLGFARGDLGYFGRAVVAQRFSAVTAACMVVGRDVFESVGGFDADRFGIAFNDVDFCLRIGEAGFGVVWTPYAELYHHESASLGSPSTGARREQFEREAASFRARWREVIANDPFYNPNLTLSGGDFSLAFPPRVRKPWTESDTPGDC